MRALLISLLGLFLFSCGTQKGLESTPVAISKSKELSAKKESSNRALPPNTASNKYSKKRIKN